MSDAQAIAFASVALTTVAAVVVFFIRLCVYQSQRAADERAATIAARRETEASIELQQITAGLEQSAADAAAAVGGMGTAIDIAMAPLPGRRSPRAPSPKQQRAPSPQPPPMPPRLFAPAQLPVLPGVVVSDHDEHPAAAAAPVSAGVAAMRRVVSMARRAAAAASSDPRHVRRSSLAAVVVQPTPAESPI